MANKTKIVRHTHRPMYENIYTRGDEKQWKCWEINKNETKKEKKKREVGWHVFLPLYEISKGSSADGKATTCTNITTTPASLTRVKKKKERKKPLSIHFCWLDVGVESGHNQRRLSLSWKLFIFQELPKGFEQNWRHIRQSKKQKSDDSIQILLSPDLYYYRPNV